MACIEVTIENRTAPHLDVTASHVCNIAEGKKGEPAEFIFRATNNGKARDGAARIKRIKGNSVVWNQWAKSFEEANEKPNYDGITYNGNKVTIDNWRAYNAFRFDIKCSTAKDHLYLVLLNYANTNPDQRIYIEFGGENSIDQKVGNIAYFHRNIIYNNAYKDAFTLYLAETLEGTITLSDLQVIDLTKMFGEGYEPSTIEEFNARKPIVADEYAYNEGEVIHCNTTSIRSVGDNAWDAAQAIKGFLTDEDGSFLPSLDSMYYSCLIKCIAGAQYYFQDALNGFYKATAYYYGESMNFLGYKYVSAGSGFNSSGIIDTPENAHYMRVQCHEDYLDSCMVTLVHSGRKQDTDAGYQPYWQDTLPLPVIHKYFPDGMKKAGTAHDEIRYNKASGKWEAIQRIGFVNITDIPILDAGLADAGVEYYYIAPRYLPGDMKSNPDSNIKANMLLAQLPTENWEDLYWGRVKRGISLTSDSLQIVEPAAPEIEDLVDLLLDSYLYYELAEPIVTEMNVPLDLYYRVGSSGTEEALAIKSAPFSADIVYP